MTTSAAQITEMFGAVLGRGCGPLDNFFDLGGDSLLAEAIMARIGEWHGREVDVALLLEYPTPSDLAIALADPDLA